MQQIRYEKFALYSAKAHAYKFRKRVRLPEHLAGRNLADIKSEKLLRMYFSDGEIKGMMMVRKLLIFAVWCFLTVYPALSLHTSRRRASN